MSLRTAALAPTPTLYSRSIYLDSTSLFFFSLMVVESNLALGRGRSGSETLQPGGW
jgi:hypothetical protein